MVMVLNRPSYTVTWDEDVEVLDGATFNIADMLAKAGKTLE